jgi:hypothetical protein
VAGQKRVVEKVWREFFSNPSQGNARYPDFSREDEHNKISTATRDYYHVGREAGQKPKWCLLYTLRAVGSSSLEVSFFSSSLSSMGGKQSGAQRQDWHMQGIQILNIRRKHRRHSGLMTNRNPPGCEQT